MKDPSFVVPKWAKPLLNSKRFFFMASQSWVINALKSAKVKRFIWKMAKKTSKTTITFSKLYQFSWKFIQNKFIWIQTKCLKRIFEFLIFFIILGGPKCHFLRFFEKWPLFWPKMTHKIEKSQKFKNRLQTFCWHYYEVVSCKFLGKLKQIWKSYSLFRRFFYRFSKSWSKYCIFGNCLLGRPTCKWP